LFSRQQVEDSAKNARENVKDYFERIKASVCESLSNRLHQLLKEIDAMEADNLQPLLECEDMINTAMASASDCMEQGKLSNVQRHFFSQMVLLFLHKNK